MSVSRPASVTGARSNGEDPLDSVHPKNVSERSSLTAHTDSTSTPTYGATVRSPSSSHTVINDSSTDESPWLDSKHHHHPTVNHDDDDDDDHDHDVEAQTQALLTTAPMTAPTATVRVRPVAEAAPAHLHAKTLLWIIAPMMLAVFLANLDSTIVFATHARIASQFMSLESSSWLFTGFVLAATAMQTTLVQLSEVYGRKPVMMCSYFVFALGMLITGAAGSMIVAVMGRLLSGSVSAGNDVLVTLVVTDLLPVREVAAWRSYINVVAVIGKCVGGPLGGWLADAIGWRLSFIGQAPLFLLTLILCWISLPNTKPKRQQAAAQSPPGSLVSAGNKLRQVDFLGSVLFATFLILLLLPIEFGGTKMPWTDPQIPVYFCGAMIALGLFIVAEKRRDPGSQLLPLSMFRSRNIVASFFIIILQCGAQLGMMFNVPLYFQATQGLSGSDAGARLLPAVIGNAFGGIMAGSIIRNTGKYKWLIFLAAALSATAHTLMILRWQGKTSWWETLYIFPGGFGTAVTLAGLFIAAQVSVDKAHIAPAISMCFLAQGLGAVLGLAAAAAVYQAGLRSTLEERLVLLHLDADTRNEIIANAVASVDYIRQAKGSIATAVMASYADGLWYSHFVSLFASLLAFALAALLRECKI